MKFEYDDSELNILDDDLPEDDDLVFNYSKTMAGHTIMIDARFKLVPTGLPNIYTIELRKSKDKEVLRDG